MREGGPVNRQPQATIWSPGRASNHLIRGQGPYGLLKLPPCLLWTLILKFPELETGLKRKFSAREPAAMISEDLLSAPVTDGHSDAQGTDPLGTRQLPNWEAPAAGQACLFTSGEKLL